MRFVCLNVRKITQGFNVYVFNITIINQYQRDYITANKTVQWRVVICVHCVPVPGNVRSLARPWTMGQGTAAVTQWPLATHVSRPPPPPQPSIDCTTPGAVVSGVRWRGRGEGDTRESSDTQLSKCC